MLSGKDLLMFQSSIASQKSWISTVSCCPESQLSVVITQFYIPPAIKMWANTWISPTSGPTVYH